MLLLDVYEIGQLPERFENEIVRWPRYSENRDGSGAFLLFDLVTRAFEFRGHAPGGFNGPLVNGKQVTESRLRLDLKANDVVLWRNTGFVISNSIEPSRDERRVLAAMQTDPTERAVYADWLESRGADQCAEYVRLSGKPETGARTERMASVASRVSISFRAMVATAPIERCFVETCPGRWEALPFSGAEPQGEALNPSISMSTRLAPTVYSTRHCLVCKSGVRFIARAALARTFEGPVVIEPSSARRSGDLHPEPEEGRPLVVDGLARAAAVIGAPPVDHSKLIEGLTRAALAEHASIATFARTICELMALGAPLELLTETQQALADEIRHAAMTFEQIERLGGGSRRASVLPEAVAPMKRSVAEFREDVRAGAEGEEAGVRAARQKAALTQDLALRAFYTAIADDEVRHAALARRTVEWLDALLDDC